MGFIEAQRFLIVMFLASLACASQLSADDVKPGVLEGHITVGPLRPGPTRIDEGEQLPPPQFFASHRILVLSEDKRKIKDTALDAKGAFKVELAPGKYLVALEPNDIGIKKPPPSPVTIVSGKTTKLDLDFDTGMR